MTADENLRKGKPAGGEPPRVELMTPAQADRLRHLSKQAFEPDAFKPNLDRAEAARRIAALEAKLPLQDGPPHPI